MRAHVLAGDWSWVATQGMEGAAFPLMPMLGWRVPHPMLGGHQSGSVWPSPVATATTLPFHGP
eukprot:14946404-Heterocapsa_arctica.AAC.1